MALVSAYDGLIFDFGGVLVSAQTDEDRAQMAAIAGVPQPRFTASYWEHRLDYDKGDLTTEQYWRAVVCDGTNEKLDRQTIEHLNEIDTESWMRFDTVMWDWILQLRSGGKRLAMLSNMPRELGEALKTRTDRLSHFDQVTLSYEVRTAKPDPVIYEHCLNGLLTPPERTLFLDDRAENIRGAEFVGIQGVQFLDRNDVLLRLRD